ncbi:hypothetical protein D3C81_729360 [compost metagenome]
MHSCLRRRATALQRLMKQACIRFGDANVFGAQRKLEVVRQPQSPHISIAVGDHAEGVVVGQYFQGWLHFGEDFQLMPGMQEHFEALVGQV